jgi:hypothetical protein
VNGINWYWSIVGTASGFICAWALITGSICGAFNKDYWTPQMKWLGDTITGPFKWVAGIVTSPGTLI